MSDAQVVAQYVLENLKARHGWRFAGSRRPNAPRRSAAERMTLNSLDLLREYQLFGVSGDAHDGLLGWLESRYPLYLRADIPTPNQMLDLQCAGKRCVTLMTDPADQSRRFGRHHGALEFLLHDLEHGQKFFGRPELAQGQQNFFIWLRALLNSAAWPGFDAKFDSELDYVKSDMNSHPLHMFKYLKAILLNAIKREDLTVDSDIRCADLLRTKYLPEETWRINMPGVETRDDQVAVTNFFMTL